MDGTAKEWKADKGYGFITGTDGKDYFVHYSDIMLDSPRRDLTKGQHVIFTPTTSTKGLKAVRVFPAVISDEAAEAAGPKPRELHLQVTTTSTEVSSV